MKIKKYIHLKNNLKPILNVSVPWNKSILLTVSFTTTYYCFTICFLIFFCFAALWVITTSTSIVNELASSCWLFFGYGYDRKQPCNLIYKLQRLFPAQAAKRMSQNRYTLFFSRHYVLFWKTKFDIFFHRRSSK